MAEWSTRFAKDALETKKEIEKAREECKKAMAISGYLEKYNAWKSIPEIEARVRQETAKEIFDEIEFEMICDGCDHKGIPERACCPEASYFLWEHKFNEIKARFLKPTDKEVNK